MSENVIIDVRLIADSETVKALATVTLTTELGELTITRFKVIQKGNDEPWVAIPNIRYLDEKTKQYKNVEIFIECRRFRQAVSKLILEKYFVLINKESAF